MKTILHLCADIGSDSKPYRDAGGYEVICVGKNVGVENYHPPKNVYGVIANPPCTHFSVARTCAATPRDLREGMRLVKECLRIIWECQYDIETATRRSKTEIIKKKYEVMKIYIKKLANGCLCNLAVNEHSKTPCNNQLLAFEAIQKCEDIEQRI